MFNMATPLHNTPYPLDHEIYKLWRPVLGYHYFILSLSDLRPSLEMKIFIYGFNAFSLYDLFGNAPAQEPLYRWSLNLQFLEDNSLVIITIYT